VAEVGNEWTFNQLDEFIVSNGLKSQNPKHMMNSVDSLYNTATNLKVVRIRWAFNIKSI
jgi:hypothetical protein